MACSSCNKKRAQFRKTMEARKAKRKNILAEREKDAFQKSLEGLRPVQKRRKIREERGRKRKARLEARRARIQKRNEIKARDAEAKKEDKSSD